MQHALLKLKWLYKLALSNSFVVMTDRESAVVIPGLQEPFYLEDEQVIHSQRASLALFREQLDELIKTHDDMTGSSDVPKKTKASKKSVK